jgi:hypothetical protein
VTVIANLVLAAAVAAAATIIAIVVRIAAAVGDALVALAMLVLAAANALPVVADLVLAAAHATAAAILAIIADVRLAPVGGFAIAVRPTRTARRDVARTLATGRAGVVERAVVATGATVPIVGVGIGARTGA